MKIMTLCTVLLTSVLLTGCVTNDEFEVESEKFLTEREQKTALARVKNPRYFGFQVYPAQGGLGFQGQARLHPNHTAQMDFIKGEPVIEFRGRSKRNSGAALLDFSSPVTWINYSTAEMFGAVFMGLNGDVIPYRGGGNGADSFAAVISQLRFDQCFMENVPLYVRMSRGSLGPAARGISKPHVDMAFGYDVLGLFETIQLNLRDGVVAFSASHSYTPNEDLLMSAADIQRVPGYGLAVNGSVYGVDTPVVLDPAGDYSFMRSDKKVSQTKQVSLGDLVYRQVPTEFIPYSGALPRAGRQMLDKYLITICPRMGKVYFERFPKER